MMELEALEKRLVWLFQHPKGVDLFPVDPVGPDLMVAGVVPRWGCCMGVPLDLKFPDPVSEEGSAIGVTVQLLKRTGRSLLVFCRHQGMSELFAVFCAHLMREQGFAEDPVGCFRRLLKQWRLLFAVATEEGQMPAFIGLWGELYFVRTCMLGSTALAKGWVGPTGADRDYELASTACEIKTSIRKNATSVRISSIRQLDWVKGPLWLGVCSIWRAGEGQEGCSIAEMWNAVAGGPLSQPTRVAVERELNGLPEELINARFHCSSFLMYPVNNLFPIITAKTLGLDKGLHTRLISLNYTIDISGLNSITLEQWLNDRDEV